MASKWLKSLLVAAFSLVSLFFFNMSQAQDSPAGTNGADRKEAPKLDPAKIILEHVGDGHEFHFFTFHEKPVSIPLPVILYSPGKGWSVFMASRFEHGHQTNNGYRLMNEEYIGENKLDEKVYKPGRIWAV